MSRTFRNRHNRGDGWWFRSKPKYYFMSHANFECSWAQECSEHEVKTHRDGVLHDRGHFLYKEIADQERRNKERNFLVKVRKGYYDIEDIAYPCEKEQKQYMWDVW